VTGLPLPLIHFAIVLPTLLFHVPGWGGGKEAKVQFLSAMYLEWAECTGKFRSWIAHSLSDVDIVRQLQAYNILPLPPDSPFVKDGNYSSDNDHNNGRSSTIRYAPLCL